jgi:hypothetical protein
MSPVTGQPGTAAALAAAVVLGGLVLAGCTTGHTAKKAPHVGASSQAPARTAVAGPRGTLDGFIAKLQAGAATPFEAEYAYFGKRPAMIVYAVRPPDGLLFEVIPLAGTGRRTQLVANGSGEYRCAQRGTGHAPWTCQQLSKASAAAQNKSFGIYTAAHWAAYLKTVTLATGAKVTTFTAPPNMAPIIGKGNPVAGMKCIGFRTAGLTGGSTICAAAPGILGSVVGCVNTSIVMHRYITSPPASLFRLPPGAKVIGQGAQQPRAA